MVVDTVVDVFRNVQRIQKRNGSTWDEAHMMKRKKEYTTEDLPGPWPTKVIVLVPVSERTFLT